MRLQNRVAVVTGGGRGIGKAYCNRLAQEGAAIVVADLAYADAQAVAEQIRQFGGRAVAVKVDVADLESTRTMAKAAVEAFGGIDILINNAAMFSNLTRKAWTEFTPQEFDQVMAVNVKGTWLVTLAVAPYMKQRGKGKIVNIGSASIYSGESRLIHYVASKAAVMGLTRSLARELGPDNISVNCLHPGQTMSGTNDENTPAEFIQMQVQRRSLKKVQTPSDLVGAMVFLVSDDADFITGQSIVVDGGMFFVG